jgi:hypothetical protein
MDQWTSGDGATGDWAAGDGAAADWAAGDGLAVAPEPWTFEDRDPGPTYESILASAERLLDDVEAALARLDAGTYHACADCGAPVDAAAVSDPLDPRCEHHAA